MELNEVTAKLPKHLLQFVVDQPYAEYTAIDQAVWRYVMRRNCEHLKKIAHESYLHGLEVTGVEIDRIPTMYGMNRILKEIGWAAVAVDGFIPPGAFMEFTQYNVLVIAADIRTLEHIEYTPAPDIIHESAGHAPILAVPEFASYLRAIGEAGAKAFSSRKDVELYEAIRHLSIIKEDPVTTPEEISFAEEAIARIQGNMGPPSEMALIRNLHWWTVEYGLIGTPDNFKLYGAGLLSSIGEAISCLSSDVQKLPYTLDAMYCNYDITKPQPQLFITPDFAHLIKVLEEFKQRMAWIKGGGDGVKKAIESQDTSTLVFSSGLQVTGNFSDAIFQQGEPVFISTDGPTALSAGNKQLSGYGKDRFPKGIVAPVGRLRNLEGSPAHASQTSLDALGIVPGRAVTLEFVSGISVKGTVTELVRDERGVLLFMNLADVQITYGGRLMHKLAECTMPVGDRIDSAFAGAADIASFEPDTSVPREKMHKIIHDESSLRLQKLYGEVRALREHGGDTLRLNDIFHTVKRDFPRDWLLSLEILELLTDDRYRARQYFREDPNTLRTEVRSYLEERSESAAGLEQLISNGLNLLNIKSTAV